MEIKKYFGNKITKCTPRLIPMGYFSKYVFFYGRSRQITAFWKSKWNNHYLGHVKIYPTVYSAPHLWNSYGTSLFCLLFLLGFYHHSVPQGIVLVSEPSLHRPHRIFWVSYPIIREWREPKSASYNSPMFLKCIFQKIFPFQEIKYLPNQEHLVCSKQNRMQLLCAKFGLFTFFLP